MEMNSNKILEMENSEQEAILRERLARLKADYNLPLHLERSKDQHN